MPYLRFARNCVNSSSCIATLCPCCEGIKLLVIDGQERIRAVANMTVDELRDVVKRFDAGALPTFTAWDEGRGTSH